ncbi:DEDD exonuclease domain-containing protein [Microlunatus elymi]|uniref:DEDD exonuclease domain-containing protein n=1 Tax=Microlunatus elymi TaxID=2596828 RepID=A0A516Q2I5_9ACTN|nr:DEDD exonuclease domain-containing protein [Microlunatus elymi]QDP97636.1 DEDD exonuclease domain-containing protein [Microlunatus elymi]
MTSRTRENSLQDSFADLGVPLWDTTFCVVDLETTGGAETDSITEIGAVKVRGGEVLGEFQTLVNPHTHIPPLVAVLTGITNQMVASAPPISEALPAFLEFAHGTVLVAHNARFDVGFLRRNCAELGYPWPKFGILDTVALARHILLADEVPDCKLSTLARHFHTTATPNHRALTDAQATVDVLHALIERVGNLGVGTYEELREFTRKVSPQRRSKRSWAKELPEAPGVYFFVADDQLSGDPEARQILYVGKSSNLRRRVRSYFTAAEKRPRMEEMIRVATGVEAYPCQTPLHAEVTELRMIATHAPRYNRRSKFPERQQWIKITTDAYPRLSRVAQVKEDGATYFGPFSRRQQTDDVIDALYDAFPIRQCTQRLSPTRPSPACALAEMHRCAAPCDGSISVEGYHDLVEQVRDTLTRDVRGACTALRLRLRRLVAEQRYEEAEILRRRLAALLDAGARFHRVSSLAGCRQIVAARWVAPDWQIHVIRHGRLAAAGLSKPGEVPQAVARALIATAETVPAPIGPQSGATVEETLRIADWMEQPGVRLIDIDGDWAWPLHGVLSHEQLVGHVLGA